MSVQENEAILRRLFESIKTGNAAGLEDYVSPNWENHDPSLPPMKGRDGARKLVTLFRNSFSDLDLRIEQLFGEGDWLACHFEFSGRHTGDFQGIPPTGKSASVTGTGVFHFSNGQITDNYVNIDALGLLQQLGAVPMPGQEQRRAA